MAKCIFSDCFQTLKVSTEDKLALVKSHLSEEAKAELQAHKDEVSRLHEQIATLHFERRKDAVVMRMAPRLQSSAEKLRQHLLGRSRGRAASRTVSLTMRPTM